MQKVLILFMSLIAITVIVIGICIIGAIVCGNAIKFPSRNTTTVYLYNYAGTAKLFKPSVLQPNKEYYVYDMYATIDGHEYRDRYMSSKKFDDRFHQVVVRYSDKHGMIFMDDSVKDKQRRIITLVFLLTIFFAIFANIPVAIITFGMKW